MHHFRTFLSHRQGSALIEMAIILPVLLSLSVGAAELCYMMMVNYKADKMAATIGEATSQAIEVTPSDLNIIVTNARQIMDPMQFAGTVNISMITKFSTPRNPPAGSLESYCNGNSNELCMRWTRGFSYTRYRSPQISGGQGSQPNNIPGGIAASIPVDKGILVTEISIYYTPILPTISNIFPFFKERWLPRKIYYNYPTLNYVELRP